MATTITAPGAIVGIPSDLGYGLEPYGLSPYGGESEPTTTPLAVDGYEAEHEDRNVIHDLLGGGIAVVIRPPRPRSGTLELVYDDEAEAWFALELHRTGRTFTLTNDEIPALDMTYVRGGNPGIRIDDARVAWVVSVPFQEISP